MNRGENIKLDFVTASAESTALRSAAVFWISIDTACKCVQTGVVIAALVLSENQLSRRPHGTLSRESEARASIWLTCIMSALEIKTAHRLFMFLYT